MNILIHELLLSQFVLMGKLFFGAKSHPEPMMATLYFTCHFGGLVLCFTVFKVIGWGCLWHFLDLPVRLLNLIVWTGMRTFHQWECLYSPVWQAPSKCIMSCNGERFPRFAGISRFHGCTSSSCGSLRGHFYLCDCGWLFKLWKLNCSAYLYILVSICVECGQIRLWIITSQITITIRETWWMKTEISYDF